MASVGEKTKEKIIRACKKLFYEKGYYNTSYKDIQKETGILPGTIAYHFKTKTELAKVIFIDTCKTNNMLADSMLKGNESSLIKYLVSVRIFWHKFYQDDKYRRFVTDAQMEFCNTGSNEYFQEYYLNMFVDDIYEDPIEYELAVATLRGYDAIVGKYVSDNIERVPIETCIASYDRFDAFLLRVDKKVMKESIEKANEILKDFKFENLKYDL